MSLDAVLRLEQLSPSDWGAAVDYDRWERRGRGEQCFVHWPGAKVPRKVLAGDLAAECRYLRNLERFHREGRGWQGLAYDWAILPSGRLARVRGAARSAATSGDVDGDGVPNNVQGEAVLVVVDLDGSPNAAQLRALEVFVGVLAPLALYGHREASTTGTTCPGPDLQRWAEAHRADPPRGAIVEPIMYARRGTPDFAAACWAAAARGVGSASCDLAAVRRAAKAGARVIAVGGPAARDLEGYPHQAARGGDAVDTMAALLEII